MRCAPLGLAFLLQAVALIGPGAASAQPAASSLEELHRLASTKSNATVTDSSGKQFKGAIVDASETRLSLRVGNDVRQFEAADVRQVRVRMEDSLANGVLIGAVTAGGLTSLMFLDNECHDDPVCYQAVAVYAGIGALAGLGIDALIHRHAVVYARPAAGDSLRIAPIFARGRAGVKLVVNMR